MRKRFLRELVPVLRAYVKQVLPKDFWMCRLEITKDLYYELLFDWVAPELARIVEVMGKVVVEVSRENYHSEGIDFTVRVVWPFDDIVYLPVEDYATLLIAGHEKALDAFRLFVKIIAESKNVGLPSERLKDSLKNLKIKKVAKIWLET